MLIVSKMPPLNLEGAAFSVTRVKNRNRLIPTKKKGNVLANLRPIIS